MRKSLFLFTIVLLVSLHSNCQKQSIFDWTKLIKANKCEEANRLCLAFVDSPITVEKAEAQKCFANVSLCENEVFKLRGDGATGEALESSYSEEGINEALKHLNLGIKLAPQDLSIHQGRLHILEEAGRYSEMIKALDESCTIYKGNDALQAWLAYSAELMHLGQYEAGLAFMKVLDKHYPNSPDIFGNMGAFLSLLYRDSEAISYLQKAVQLAPNDPINAWDLGRTYDYAGQIELADTWYQKALSLDTNTERRKQSSCLYAIFVETKLHDRTRACVMEKKDCEEDKQTACATSADSNKPPQ
jgi:tetratricopeptide (TPR) repeat protein